MTLDFGDPSKKISTQLNVISELRVIDDLKLCALSFVLVLLYARSCNVIFLALRKNFTMKYHARKSGSNRACAKCVKLLVV